MRPLVVFLLLNETVEMLDEVLHIFYPRICAGCDALLAEGEREICRDCIVSFDRFSDAEAADRAVKNVFMHNFAAGDIPQKALTLYRFHKNDRLRKVIHAMKYEGVYRLSSLFGTLLAEMIGGSLIAGHCDCIVPVPLHKLKVIERTYNQSEIIARSLGAALGKDVRVDLVTRTKYTESQAGLSPRERLRNVGNAFAPSGNAVPENILLVDDVLTTGSTVAAVMQSLKSAGASNISLATIALAA